MNASTSMGKIQYGILVFLWIFWLITSNGFESPLLVRFLGPLSGNPINAIVTSILLLVLFSGSKHKLGCCHFRLFINAFVLLPFVSAIPCAIFNNQPILSSLKCVYCSYTSILLLYYVLHILQVSSKTLKYAIGSIAIFLVFVVIFQQIFPGFAYFGTYADNELVSGKDVELRNGLLRYRIRGVEFLILGCLWCWTNFMRKIKWKYLLASFLFLAGIYLLLTRQVLFATLFCMFMAVIFIKRGNWWAKIIVVCIMLAIVVLFGATLFSSMLETANDTLGDKDYVRFIAYEKFWSESVANPICFFFGNGLSDGVSSYGIYLSRLQNFGLYTADIGFVGQGFEYGYIFVTLYYVMLAYIFFRYRKDVSLYLFLFMLVMFCCSIMLLPIGKMAIWAVILYLCDLDIERNKISVDSKNN